VAGDRTVSDGATVSAGGGRAWSWRRVALGPEWGVGVGLGLGVGLAWESAPESESVSTLALASVGRPPRDAYRPRMAVTSNGVRPVVTCNRGTSRRRARPYAGARVRGRLRAAPR